MRATLQACLQLCCWKMQVVCRSTCERTVIIRQERKVAAGRSHEAMVTLRMRATALPYASVPDHCLGMLLAHGWRVLRGREFPSPSVSLPCTSCGVSVANEKSKVSSHMPMLCLSLSSFCRKICPPFLRSGSGSSYRTLGVG